jgi:LPXTG-motif cell wall-anchored protein
METLQNLLTLLGIAAVLGAYFYFMKKGMLPGG